MEADTIAISPVDDYTQWTRASAGSAGTDPKNFQVADGFTVELIRSAAKRRRLVDQPGERSARTMDHRHGKARLAAAQAEQQSQKSKLLGLEFRTLVNYLLRIPAQVVKTARKIVVRVLAYNSWLPVFFRLSEEFSRPRRC